ncbi:MULTISPECIES: GntR family transcriptional regulator [Cupriavidus]|uniref:GntR family transcriptional regulator n=2 Tax=Cupriavidus TaxID=106589 RepID=A0A0C4Y7H2_9BURK|nr:MULTISPECIES: GntR family transcriptional regulator [Cupriavidus]AJG21372.1 Transcriptional regulator, GntR family [Cupriavidus basilensis]MBB1632703.1 GntR family transcriptional regulator [Cupriavidus sp. UME77]MCP3019954.1 GntR family transcriptional regulator [Cupriavidus basilensis]MDR3385228.1 GntR family transcriptional regulator [Cupriavidus basilensis]NUA29019.1 GntR family transcriptional regulator [Cupriavidus basilensis]
MPEHIDPAMTAEAIAEDIVAAIVSHRLPPGTKLREEALASVYRVSRTKVRAALLMLSKDKLIQIVPDKGAFVAKPSAEEAREVFAVRRILEAALAREFVARATAADYKRIDRHLVAEKKALGGSDAHVRTRLLSDFHIMLADVVGNGVLTGMLQELSLRSAVITMLYQSRRDAACSSDEHRDFIEAARAGDTERAVTLMVEHLNHVEAALHFEQVPAARSKDLVTALLA